MAPVIDTIPVGDTALLVDDTTLPADDTTPLVDDTTLLVVDMRLVGDRKSVVEGMPTITGAISLESQLSGRVQVGWA
jgi:hypothetical protein